MLSLSPPMSPSLGNTSNYTPKPLKTTHHIMEYMCFRGLPAVQNAFMAIACFSGYNREDPNSLDAKYDVDSAASSYCI